jgi:hypothetical protein
MGMTSVLAETPQLKENDHEDIHFDPRGDIRPHRVTTTSAKADVDFPKFGTQAWWDQQAGRTALMRPPE